MILRGHYKIKAADERPPLNYLLLPFIAGTPGLFHPDHLSMHVNNDLEACHAKISPHIFGNACQHQLVKLLVDVPELCFDGGFGEDIFLTEHFGGAKIYFKRDELNHTGSHKINNCLGQIQLARRMGKTRIIAETGAGQHGVATATVCARFGLPCAVYMGRTDVERQKPNVFRMRLLGAEVHPVTAGAGTLKDAMNEALRDWVTNVETTYYLIGTAAGPHPYPAMVRDFQSVIGEECLAQMPELAGRQPDAVIACVGGGSNAMGIFYPYLKHDKTRLIGVEAAGEGLSTGRHAASLCAGRPGVLHGNRTYLLQDANGQITETHSVSAGLDYPGVGPEHAWLKDSGRAEYVAIDDEEALQAFHALCRPEGIIPALESAHAVAQAMKMAPTMNKDAILLVNLSGRGDKDLHTVAERSGTKL